MVVGPKINLFVTTIELLSWIETRLVETTDNNIVIIGIKSKVMESLCISLRNSLRVWYRNKTGVKKRPGVMMPVAAINNILRIAR